MSDGGRCTSSVTATCRSPLPLVRFSKLTVFTYTPDVLTQSYLTEISGSDTPVVPYVLQPDAARALTYAQLGKVEKAEGGDGDEEDTDVARQLRELEERLASLEKMLEKAIDRLNQKIK